MKPDDGFSRDQWPRWVIAIMIFMSGVIIGGAIADLLTKLA